MSPSHLIKSAYRIKRDVQRRLKWRYREATWRSRPLPDFVIIGAQKAGTTSMHAYLSQHPELLPAYRKEVHYFDGGLDVETDNYAKGPVWYRSQFPRRPSGAAMKVFEASPLYLFSPWVPRRMWELVPEVKLIALLRNPTERALSHYFHIHRIGKEPLLMQEAFATEEERLAPMAARQAFKSDPYRYYSYKKRGQYREQLDRFLEYYPEEQLLTLCSEDFFSRPAETLRQVFEFVGVDADFEVSDLKPRNVGGNRKEVAPEIYEALDAHFRPYNEALYALVGQDYGW